GQRAREQRNTGQNDESSKHESSFREGFEVCGGAEGLLTRGSPLHHLPSLAASGLRRRSSSPHSGGTVPDSHRVPLPRTVNSTLSWPDASLAGALALVARARLGGRHLHVLVH